MNPDTPAAPICVTCGTQYPPSETSPDRCPICEDERQYVGLDGQKWTTLEEVRRDHRNVFFPMEDGVTAILTKPSFAIGQRAFLMEAPGGNLLWDCVTLLDEATVQEIRNRGGLAAIAISHPHYYSAMVEWMDAFDVPVYLHAEDRQWVMRPDSRIRFWEGETHALGGGMKLVRAGGHFPGGTVLHHPAAASGAGALFSGDIIQVVPDRRWVSFMYSYPNLIPLSAAEVRRMVDCVASYRFDRIYGAFHPMQVMSNGEEVLARSAERYIRFLQGDGR
ncbi:MAG TPA: MBL fold metallo-hydrolase [Bryobacteraceae bacterium]|nr:MBL fold metallo-hydrolase [Bryobacteraceae bacterium]